MTQSTRKRIGCILALAVIAAITYWRVEQSERLSPSKDSIASIAPSNIPSPCQTRLFDGSRFTICPAAPTSTQARMILTGTSGRPLRSLAALKSITETDKTRPLFAMNAGMYDDMGEPIGLYVSEGKTRKPLNRAPGEGNFHLLPNGVFWVDSAGHYHVGTAAVYANRKIAPDAIEATQSGPMLVIGGKLHPEFSADGTSRYRRNGVGLDKQGTAWFAISEEPISFGKFARLFRDELGCANALYFDGAVSSIWIPSENRLEIGSPIGPMILIEKR